MTVTMDLGYTNFYSKGNFEEKLVCTKEELEEGKIEIPAHQVFSMLKQLPRGIRWNPNTEKFEEETVNEKFRICC